MSKVKVDAILPATGGGTPTFEGDGASVVGKIKINCEQNTHGVTIQSPAHSSGANYTITLPANDGDADQFLQTNGSGVTSWAASSSYRIGAVAFMNSTQTIATGTETKLEMDAERYDPNGDYNTSTYLYTVPSGHDGKYLVLGRAGCQALGDGKRLGLIIYINSALKEYHYAGHSAANSAYASCNGIFDLSASDTISLYGWHDKGSNGDWTGNANGYDSLFAVQRIA